jgi:predicted S18 family serine protease
LIDGPDKTHIPNSQSPQVFIGLIKCALQKKENRLQRQKEFEERRREEQKRQELFEAIQHEKDRVQNLEIEVENWHRAAKIRAYIEAVKSKAKENADAASLAEWISWAEQQADRLDPLVESLPSILDEELQIE